MQWDMIIGAIVHPRLRFAGQLGVGEDDLWSVARLAALEAERTWQPGAGATPSSWVWLQVAGRVSHLLRRASWELARDTVADELEDLADGTDLETRAIVREALSVLQAKLRPDEYRILWCYHGLGMSSAELAELHGVGEDAVFQRLSRARKKAVRFLSLAA